MILSEHLAGMCFKIRRACQSRSLLNPLLMMVVPFMNSYEPVTTPELDVPDYEVRERIEKVRVNHVCVLIYLLKQ